MSQAEPEVKREVKMVNILNKLYILATIIANKDFELFNILGARFIQRA